MLKAGFGTKGPLIKDLRLKFFFLNFTPSFEKY